MTSVGAVQVGVSVDRRVSENVKLGMGVDVAPNGGTMVKLRFVLLPPLLRLHCPDEFDAAQSRFARLGQRINLPVIVSSAFDSRLFIGFTLVPALGIIATNHFVLAPRQRKRLSGYVSSHHLSPSVLFCCFCRGVVRMYGEERLTRHDENRKLKELRKEHAEYIKEKRQEALDAQELLKEHAKKRAEEEEKKNGTSHPTYFSLQLVKYEEQ